MADITDSDRNLNLTMLATKSFDQILEQIQSSCLNFHIQISPFSAVISLKKSLIRDQSGEPRLPVNPNKSSSDHVEALIAKNKELESKLATLTNEHAKLIDDSIEAHNTIKSYRTSTRRHV